MIYPKKLVKGSKVGLVAPSGPIDDERWEAAVNACHELGLLPVMGKSIFENLGFLAGSDSLRAADINEMFADKTIDGIFCIRGGYGSQRIIPLLDVKTITQNPKVFVGYSDITALHTFLNHLGLITYHGPMLCADFLKGIDEFSYHCFKENIFSTFKGKISNPKDHELHAYNALKCSGILAGGNLSVLASSIGTSYALDFTNKVVLLEDVGEEPYAVDRMLNQLLNCGQLSKAKGFILGHFTNCQRKGSWGPTVFDVLEFYLKPLNKPCITGLCCGHELPNITLPLGATVTIDGLNMIVV